MAIQSIAPSTTTVISDEGGERKTMHSKVSDNGAARIASMVVNMYADPVSAVTREYIANAVDATIAAGSKAPVEVTVPTLLNPTLVVKDHGIGMDAATVENAFLAFAESTKGDTNDQIGGLGVGAKSAWTVCEAFIVDTVKDGKRNVVRASRDLEHEVMVSDADTDLPNGTTVTIPVKVDGVAWNDEILKVAMFHKRGAVLVDGKPVTSVHDGKRLGPVRIGVVRGINGRLKVMSGGTMFGVPSTLTNLLSEEIPNVSAVIELPVGSFSHTPNRDFLIADDRTRRALTDALKAFRKAHDATLKRLLTVAKKDVSAALHKRAEYLNGERTRKLLPLPYEVDFGSPHTYIPNRRGSRASVWNRVTSLRRSLYELDQLPRTVVVTGVPEGKALKGIGRYMDTEHDFATTLVAIPEGETEVAFKVSPAPSEENSTFRISAKSHGVTVVEYAALMQRSKELAAAFAEKRPKPSQIQYPVVAVIGGKARSGSFTLTDAAKLISDTDPEMSVTIGDTGNYTSVMRVAPHRNFVIIENGRCSTAPIVKEFPNAKAFNVFREEVYVEAESAVTDEDVMRFILTNPHMSRFVHMAYMAHEIVNTEGVPSSVVSAIKSLAQANEVDVSQPVPADARSILSVRQHGYNTRVTTVTGELDAQWKALTDMYPLLDTVSYAFLTGIHFSRETRRDFKQERVQHVLDYVSSVPPLAVETAV